ncbi:acyltransferase [Vibrio campbellii]|uniref:Acyltransferase n=1 Tax=Vibrio campbellii TaxID=680 RepID=A0ACC7RFP2_9VIBR
MKNIINKVIFFLRNQGRVKFTANVYNKGTISLNKKSRISEFVNIYISKGSRLTMSDGASIGRLSTINIDGDFYLGKNSFINEKGTIYGGNIEIGEHVLIGPNVSIFSISHSLSMKEKISSQKSRRFSIKISNDVWIGSGTNIVGPVSIEQGAVVGAGSVVTHNIPAYEIWAGNPARKIGARK